MSEVSVLFLLCMYSCVGAWKHEYICKGLSAKRLKPVYGDMKQTKADPLVPPGGQLWMKVNESE